MTLYLHPAVLFSTLLGFISGLPMALSGGTLTYWMSVEKVDLKQIGLFALISMPYSLKFLVAPLLDAYPVPFLTRAMGRRRSWAFILSLGLVAAIVSLAFCQPQQDLWRTAFMGLMVASFSAALDIVVDAYRFELLKDGEVAAGIATANIGYRLAMLTSGAGALLLSTLYSWQTVYLMMAALSAIGAVIFLVGPRETAHVTSADQAPTFRHVFINPFTDFLTRPNALWFLLIIVVYRLGDNFLNRMSTPFYVQLGFSASEIALGVKTFGLWASIAGGLAGGIVVARLGNFYSVYILSLVHALTNAMFLVLHYVGHSMPCLLVAIGLENVSGAMSTAALWTFVVSLCNKQYTATQYAMLTSIASLPATFLTASSGALVESMGWVGFFYLCIGMAIPGIMIARFLQYRTAQA